MGDLHDCMRKLFERLAGVVGEECARRRLSAAQAALAVNDLATLRTELDILEPELVEFELPGAGECVQMLNSISHEVVV